MVLCLFIYYYLKVIVMGLFSLVKQVKVCFKYLCNELRI